MIRFDFTPERARFVHEVDLDGAAYRLTLTWKETLGAWYLDVRTAIGNPIVLGQRVSPGGILIPDPTIDGAPPGLLHVQGPDPYLREDLGGSLSICYLTAEEVRLARLAVIAAGES